MYFCHNFFYQVHTFCILITVNMECHACMVHFTLMANASLSMTSTDSQIIIVLTDLQTAYYNVILNDH